MPEVRRPSIFLSYLGVGRDFRGARHSNKASISAAWGSATSAGVSHSDWTTTVAGRRPRRMSFAQPTPEDPVLRADRKSVV